MALAGYVGGTATDLGAFAAGRFPAVLAPGPVYHLLTDGKRRRALAEARRVLAPGGVLLAAVLCRFAAVRYWSHERPVATARELPRELAILDTGVMVMGGADPNSRCVVDAYAERSEAIRPFMEAGGFETLDLVGAEGIFAFVQEKTAAIPDDLWPAYVDLNCRLGRKPSLLGDFLARPLRRPAAVTRPGHRSCSTSGSNGSGGGMPRCPALPELGALDAAPGSTSASCSLCPDMLSLVMRTVFLSSTGRDLVEFREAAYRAIEGLDGYHGIWMEDFGARDEQSDAFCRAKVAECDVYVGLLGHVYGGVPAGSERSYTEREYEAAIAAGKPRLMFLAPEDFPVPAALIEPDALRAKQRTFRRRVSAERIRATFRTPEELAGLVVQAIRNWEQAPRADVRRGVVGDWSPTSSARRSPGLCRCPSASCGHEHSPPRSMPPICNGSATRSSLAGTFRLVRRCQTQTPVACLPIASSTRSRPRPLRSIPTTWAAGGAT